MLKNTALFPRIPVFVFGMNLIGTLVFAGDLPAKFTPPDGRTLVIVGAFVSSFENYVSNVGIVPAGFMTYTFANKPENLAESSPGQPVSDGQYYTDRYPAIVAQVGLGMVDCCADIAAGTYDGNIDQIGDWIRRFGRPVFLRIGYEFDNPENHYDPADYVAAYRYIVDRFRRNGVGNFATVWHSYGIFQGPSKTNWYPGDDYVDWCGISLFQGGAVNAKQCLRQMNRAGKPVMICESAPVPLGTTKGEKSWSAWFRPYFQFVEREDVKAISYINWDWDAISWFVNLHWGNSCLEADPVVLAKWREEMKKPRYLQSSPELFRVLGDPAR